MLLSSQIRHLQTWRRFQASYEMINVHPVTEH